MCGGGVWGCVKCVVEGCGGVSNVWGRGVGVSSVWWRGVGGVRCVVEGCVKCVGEGCGGVSSVWGRGVGGVKCVGRGIGVGVKCVGGVRCVGTGVWGCLGVGWVWMSDVIKFGQCFFILCVFRCVLLCLVYGVCIDHVSM